MEKNLIKSSDERQPLQVLQKTTLLGKELTVYGTAENPLFLAKEVSEWIEHSNTTVMLQAIDDDEKGLNYIYTLGGSQEMWTLTEDGLYEVLMLSRKPIAKQFKKGVKRILHELRTKGAVGVVQPKTQAEVLLMYAQQMVEQERRVLAVESKNSEIESRLDELELRTSTSIEYTTVVGFARRYGIDMPNKTAQYIGKAASRQCRAKGRTIGDVGDTRYGIVHSYPNDILEEIFRTLYPNKF